MRRNLHEPSLPKKVTLRSVIVAPLIFLATTLSVAIAEGDSQQLSDIRSAWERRQSAATALTASWIVEQGLQLESVAATPDPAPLALIYMLSCDGSSRRLEWKLREWGYHPDGVARKGWRTSHFIETFKKQSGWRLLLSNDVPGMLPSGNLNRPLDTTFVDLNGVSLMMFWYRPLDANMTGIPFKAWSICNDQLLIDPRPNIVTIQSPIIGESRYALLSLDMTRDFLPVSSRSGRVVPGGGMPQPIETIVELDLAGKTNLPTPELWYTRERGRNGKVLVRSVCRLLQLSLTNDAEVDYSVPFPKNAVPNDLAATRHAPEPLSASKVSGMAASKHPVSYAYWIGGVFAVLLVTAICLKWRAGRSVSEE